MTESSNAGAAVKSDRSRGQFTFSQLVQIRIIGFVGWILVWLIGMTLRFRFENREIDTQLGKKGIPRIYSFWHNQIFPATFWFRFQNIAVITSEHFDGEYIAKIIESFGYEAVRGSSTRGGVKALLQLKKCLEKGQTVAFTIDGPRGPRYQVKPGPVFLSRRASCPILAFHIEPEKFWELNSWDRFRIPRPFSRVLLQFGKPIWIGEDQTDEAALELIQEEMDRLRRAAASYWIEH